MKRISILLSVMFFVHHGFSQNGSDKDNIRPFAIRGLKEGNPLQVLWLQNTKYLRFAYNTNINNYGGDLVHFLLLH